VLKLVERKNGCPAQIQTKIQILLPKVEVKLLPDPPKAHPMKTTLVLIVPLLAPVVGLHAVSNGMTQLASLSFGAIDLPDNRLSQSQARAPTSSTSRCSIAAKAA
jgi:hypothetical protein